MKGIVFTEFLEHVEEALGPAMVESVIDACDLASGGVYTSVGTYPCEEMGQLIGALAELSGRDPVSILHEFGGRLAETFHKAYPEHFKVPEFFDFVESVDSHIHVEVKKLYPDAELPRFHTVSREQDRLVIDYVSSRGLENLAFGLFHGCSAIFDEPVNITTDARDESNLKSVRFTLARAS
jgi:Haem-NO-binding